ncbi:hypothetical protein Lalb_Chr00c34g0408581 [Lupinus albus]|uniref:Uncharacterized protein n=1 Tax=Lupinus albus TaxID=3870 RepID=A0A6A4NC66_LUPAL|nr:hypothetical protein Lalb_Chr00c34g0408581 [Lupinus albus]
MRIHSLPSQAPTQPTSLQLIQAAMAASSSNLDTALTNIKSLRRPPRCRVNKKTGTHRCHHLPRGSP